MEKMKINVSGVRAGKTFIEILETDSFYKEICNEHAFENLYYSESENYQKMILDRASSSCGWNGSLTTWWFSTNNEYFRIAIHDFSVANLLNQEVISRYDVKRANSQSVETLFFTKEGYSNFLEHKVLQEADLLHKEAERKKAELAGKILMYKYIIYFSLIAFALLKCYYEQMGDEILLAVVIGFPMAVAITFALAAIDSMVGWSKATAEILVKIL